jgi:hypothetical protein
VFVCFSLSDDSLWNAADDDTIPDPAGHKRRFQGLHNTGWLWSTGDHTTGKHTLGGPITRNITRDREFNIQRMYFLYDEAVSENSEKLCLKNTAWNSQ